MCSPTVPRRATDSAASRATSTADSRTASGRGLRVRAGLVGTVSSGIEAGELASQWIAAATLVAAALLGLYFFKRLGGRFAVAIALAWGIAWIAVGRLSDTPYSIVVGVTAILAALVVISGVFWFRQRETSPAPAVL